MSGSPGAGDAVMSGDSGSSSGAHWVQAIGTIVSAIVGAAAAWFALTTYMDSVAKQVDERKVEVFRLHERYNAEPLFSIRKRVYADLLRNAGCESAVDAAAGPSDANDRFALVEFFDVVQACIDARLCDTSLVERLFSPYANGHWPYLKGYVEGVRTGEAGMALAAPFGTGLQTLAKNPQRLWCDTGAAAKKDQ